MKRTNNVKLADKVLITGGAGFIGANLTRRLVQLGVKPYLFIRPTSNLWRLKDVLTEINFVSVDLLNPQELSSQIKTIAPQIIFHTAAYGGYIYQQDKQAIYDNNVLATENLLQAAANIDYQLLVNTGSSSEYGLKDLPMKEADSLAPVTEYGRAKAAATNLCSAMVEKEGRPIVTLRLFSPYGYYEDKVRLVSSVIQACLKGENPKVSSPEPVRDFIFIEDVIGAYLRIAEQPERAKGEIFNIGTGEQHSTRGIINAIIEISGAKVVPAWQQIDNPRLEPKNWQADIGKIKKLMGWRPTYSLAEGLKKTIAWYREQNNG